MPMISDDIELCARRLELSARLGEGLSPADCRMVARILDVAALDAAALEDVPPAPRQVRPAPDVAVWPAHARCVTPAPARATAQIIPFPRRR